jgi:hypothetical protein
MFEMFQGLSKLARNISITMSAGVIMFQIISELSERSGLYRLAPIELNNEYDDFKALVCALRGWAKG